MGSEQSEPLEPDEVLTAEELLAKKDPRIGVADANGAVKWRPRLWRGRGAPRRNPGTDRHNEGRRH
jgi:hypothetical protein